MAERRDYLAAYPYPSYKDRRMMEARIQEERRKALEAFTPSYQKTTKEVQVKGVKGGASLQTTHL